MWTTFQCPWCLGMCLPACCLRSLQVIDTWWLLQHSSNNIEAQSTEEWEIGRRRGGSNGNRYVGTLKVIRVSIFLRHAHESLAPSSCLTPTVVANDQAPPTRFFCKNRALFQPSVQYPTSSCESAPRLVAVVRGTRFQCSLLVGQKPEIPRYLGTQRQLEQPCVGC
jgi:hypothetical protein